MKCIIRRTQLIDVVVATNWSSSYIDKPYLCNTKCPSHISFEHDYAKKTGRRLREVSRKELRMRWVGLTSARGGWHPHYQLWFARRRASQEALMVARASVMDFGKCRSRPAWLTWASCQFRLHCESRKNIPLILIFRNPYYRLAGILELTSLQQ
jgi:hypothetical protein